MTKIEFIVYLVLLIVFLISLNKILIKQFKIKESLLNYSFLIIVLLYLVIGAFMTFSETKKEFKELSNTFEGQSKTNSRPHRWWDIDTYW